MADDIVTSLRAWEAEYAGTVHADVYADAAQYIERLRADIARCAEIVRIKDDLINAQVRKIMHLSGVKG